MPRMHSRMAARLERIAAGVWATTPNPAQKSEATIRRTNAARSFRPV